MTWLAFAVGLLLTGFGATAGAALMTVSRRELTRMVSRRLRGGGPSLGWLAEADHYLTAASATTSLGLLLVGASLPGVVGASAILRSTAVLAVATVTLALVTGYLIPRWLTRPRAEAVANRVLPVIRPWSALLGLLLPARPRGRAHDLRSIWREGAAGGLGSEQEFQMIGGVMTFAQRQVREVMTPRTDIAAVEEGARWPRSRPPSPRPGTAACRSIAARSTRSWAWSTPSISSSFSPATRFRSAPSRSLPPRASAATSCSTCSASAATSRS
jgi:Hemolysins and related proteins containing CBS domains